MLLNLAHKSQYLKDFFFQASSDKEIPLAAKPKVTKNDTSDYGTSSSAEENSKKDSATKQVVPVKKKAESSSEESSDDSSEDEEQEKTSVKPAVINGKANVTNGKKAESSSEEEESDQGKWGKRKEY